MRTDLVGQAIQELGFTDDRLSDILRYLNHDDDWHQLEAQLSRYLVPAYDLGGNRVRCEPGGDSRLWRQAWPGGRN